MRLRVGVDIVELARIARAVDRHGDRFLQRVYSERELAYCAGRLPSLAARFAAKEAVSKALGCGIGAVRWRDIEVVTDPAGAPAVVLHGEASRRAEAGGLRRCEISLSHSRDYAVASAVAFGADDAGV